MSARLARLAVAGAFAALATVPATSQAMTCGELDWLCATVCNSTTATQKVCSRLN